MTDVTAVTDENGEQTGGWDDGFIARRAGEKDAAGGVDGIDALTALDRLGDLNGVEGLDGGQDGTSMPHTPIGGAYEGPLRVRLDALGELIGLSRTRVDGPTLAEAGRVLDEASARQRLSSRHTEIGRAHV